MGRPAQFNKYEKPNRTGVYNTTYGTGKREAAGGTMATAGPQGGGYHQHHHPMTLEEVRTLWIGDLQYWFDENYLSSCFAHTGEVSLSRFHFIKIGEWDVCDGLSKFFIVN